MLSSMTRRIALPLMLAVAGLAGFVLAEDSRTAPAPCVDCKKTSTVLGGIKLTYPEVLKRHAASNPEPWLQMDEARFGVEHGSLGFFVQALRPGHEDEILSRWRGLKEWASKRTANGWEILEEAPANGTRRTTLLGRHRVVTVDMVVEPEFAPSDLSRWMERSFQAAVDSVAAGNSPDAGAPPPAPADDAPTGSGM